MLGVVSRLKQLSRPVQIRRLATTVAESNVTEIDENTGKGRFSSKILRLAREGIKNGDAHFRVGGTEVYFPKARIILLRPNAKHTPYQAKFIVPKSFNKLDLRDYLFHIYGLRAMNITTQLLHGKYVRAHIGAPRYRAPQIKKMTIEMNEPFIWPEEPNPEENSLWDARIIDNLKKYRTESQRALGSDKFKPGTAFNGALGPYKPVAQSFVPKAMKRRFQNQLKQNKTNIHRLQNLIKLEEFVNK